MRIEYLNAAIELQKKLEAIEMATIHLGRTDAPETAPAWLRIAPVGASEARLLVPLDIAKAILIELSRRAHAAASEIGLDTSSIKSPDFPDAWQPHGEIVYQRRVNDLGVWCDVDKDEAEIAAAAGVTVRKVIVL